MGYQYFVDCFLHGWCTGEGGKMYSWGWKKKFKFEYCHCEEAKQVAVAIRSPCSWQRYRASLSIPTLQCEVIGNSEEWRGSYTPAAGGKKKANQHYYPTRRPFNVASPLREKQRALSKPGRYDLIPLGAASSYGKAQVAASCREQHIRSFLYPQRLLWASFSRRRYTPPSHSFLIKKHIYPFKKLHPLSGFLGSACKSA